MIDFAGPSGKRRNPPGPASALSRDAKSRRREDGPSRRVGPGHQAGNPQWSQEASSGPGSKKEDMVDQQIVDQLRSSTLLSLQLLKLWRGDSGLIVICLCLFVELGDPFDDSVVKDGSS